MLEADSDDEWFIDSIKRYQELVMFDTGDPVLQIEPCDKNSICALTRRGSEKIVISVLSLPSKVTSNGEENLIKKFSDLKIKSGIFPKSNPSQILAVYENNQLISSEENVNGVVLYNLNHSDSEQIIFDKVINFEIENPKTTLLQRDILVLAKNTKSAVIIGDLNTETVLNQFKLDNISSNINPICIEKSVAAFTLKTSGATHLFDRRSNALTGIVTIEESCDGTWSSFTDYLFYENQRSSNKIYFLSQSGVFLYHDVRNLSSPVIKVKLSHSTVNNDLRLHMNPENRDLISVSGFDDNVYLYNLKEGLTELFRHDGHSKTENCDKNTYVTDHFWYSDKYVISSAINNSINCWIPNINVNN